MAKKLIIHGCLGCPYYDGIYVECRHPSFNYNGDVHEEFKKLKGKIHNLCPLEDAE